MALSEKPVNYGGVWAAQVATTASGLSDTVEVVIPEFDVAQRWGPCKWQPRGDVTTFPARGDSCIIIFDNNRDIWIIGWWPF